MATKQVTIPDIGTVTLYKRRGNRSLRLSIAANGEVRVSMPHWLPYRAGERFALSKALWISANRPAAYSSIMEHGHALGKAHRVSFAANPAAERVATRLIGNEVRVTHPAWLPHTDDRVQTAAQKAAVRALRKEAEALLPKRLRDLSQKTGHYYQSVSVKQLKSRWGSCSSDRDITLNIFLMQLPWHLIDYVLIHELVHTKVMRHGAPFWQEFERHLPAAKQLRKEIGRYQPVLSPRPLTVA